MFHSYENPNHLCAECDRNVNTITTCSGGTDCGLRFIYCLRPHGSDVISVPLPPQLPLSPGTDDITFTEFITQIDSPNMARRYNILNRSNPFTQELRLWPVSYHSVIFHQKYCHVHTGKSAILHCCVPFSYWILCTFCSGQVPD